jgi:hypothetical protein
MRIIGVDLHARQQTMATLDTDTGEGVQKTLEHKDDKLREFYSVLRGPAQLGIEATGSMHWFLQLTEELGNLRRHRDFPIILVLRGRSTSCRQHRY